MIVLDTHAWVWWVGSPERLSESARKRIDEEAKGRSIYVSSISAWEVALLVARGRLQLTMELEQLIEDRKLESTR
jgi:PIN domain nuclease of toxin-antitoxin system